MGLNGKILVLLLLAVLACNLVGCAKCINTEYKNVEVTIVDEHHRAMWMQPVPAGKVTTYITHPAVWEITVEYDGAEYTLNDHSTYDKYENKIGQTVTGKLEIRTYDNGSVGYDIVSLE